jgi:hypothetical protein
VSSAWEVSQESTTQLMHATMSDFFLMFANVPLFLEWVIFLVTD